MDVLEKHLVKLVTNEPFYSYLSRCINKHPSDKIPTAGVYAKDGELHLVWCPSYVERLSDPQIQELLKHEFLHLVLGHCTTRVKKRKGKPDSVWFWSCDLAINSLLDVDNLPKGGLVPGRFESIPAGHRHLYDEEFVKCHEKLAEVMRKLPMFKSANWYYDKLTADPDVVKAIEKLDKQNRNGGPMDVHDMWGDLSDSEREVIERKVQGVFDKAVQEAEADLDGWGTTPYATRRLLKQMSGSSVDWHDTLRYFCGVIRSAERSRSFKKMSRRYPGLLPGARRKRVGRIAVAIDMSGSVSDAAIARIFAELEKLAENIEFTVIPFDHAVDENMIFTWKKGEKLPPRRVRFGGTNFDAPTKWVNDHRAEFDGMIVITDGIAKQPLQCLVRRCWMLVPYAHLRFDTEEMVIQMAA